MGYHSVVFGVYWEERNEWRRMVSTKQMAKSILSGAKLISKSAVIFRSHSNSIDRPRWFIVLQFHWIKRWNHMHKLNRKRRYFHSFVVLARSIQCLLFLILSPFTKIAIKSKAHIVAFGLAWNEKPGRHAYSARFANFSDRAGAGARVRK